MYDLISVSASFSLRIG